MCIYIENGYSSREEYLNLLRLDYGSELVDRMILRYQPSEDFGALIHAITEAHYYGYDAYEEDDEDEDEEEDED